MSLSIIILINEMISSLIQVFSTVFIWEHVSYCCSADLFLRSKDFRSYVPSLSVSRPFAPGVCENWSRHKLGRVHVKQRDDWIPCGWLRLYIGLKKSDFIDSNSLQKSCSNMTFSAFFFFLLTFKNNWFVTGFSAAPTFGPFIQQSCFSSTQQGPNSTFMWIVSLQELHLFQCLGCRC